MTDLEAVAQAWQAAQTAARETWDAHHQPLPAIIDPEDELAASFAIDFPAELEKRAAVAKFLSEVAIRSRAGQGLISPPVAFLQACADAAELGEHGEVSTAGLDRDAQLAVRKVLYIANERAGLYAEQGDVAVTRFARDLLQSWETFIRWSPPRPGTPVGAYGEALRRGVPAPGRAAWPD